MRYLQGEKSSFWQDFACQDDGAEITDLSLYAHDTMEVGISTTPAIALGLADHYGDGHMSTLTET